MEVFYKQLVMLLRKRYITQTQFLSDIHMNRNQMQVWAKGAVPRRDTLTNISNYFNVPVSYFWGVTDENGNPIKNGEQVHTNGSTGAFDEQLLSMFHGTTDAGRMRIIQAVMNICEEEEKKTSEQDTDAIV